MEIDRKKLADRLFRRSRRAIRPLLRPPALYRELQAAKLVRFGKDAAQGDRLVRWKNNLPIFTGKDGTEMFFLDHELAAQVAMRFDQDGFALYVALVTFSAT